MQEKKLLYIFGTRPEAIKMAPLILRTQANPSFRNCVCVTGQHRELLDSVLSTFEIEPDYDLKVMTENQQLSTLTAKILEGLSGIIAKENPDLVIVQGDTTSAMVGALAAFYNKIQVAHLEAGLRTNDKLAPYPEEMNRRIISQIASLHFAPTSKNEQKLKEEGIVDSVYVTGNTGLDALKYFNDKIEQEKLDISSLLKPSIIEEFILVTIHRRENQGDNLSRILSELNSISMKYSALRLVIIRHPNPQLSQLDTILKGQEKITIIDPVSYVDMVQLIKKAKLIITDSGGLQEESAFMGTPTVVIRKNTERSEAIKLGITKLASPELSKIEAIVSEILDDKNLYREMSQSSLIYGAGNSAELIEKVLLGL